MNDQRKISREQWEAEGEALFGPDQMTWRFVCPSCGHVATPQDWKDAGATQGAVAFSCVGRWLSTAEDAFTKTGGPCNYAGGGLIGLNPVVVVEPDEKERVAIFDFAQKEE